MQTNCDITLPEFEVQTIIGNSFLKLNGDDATAMAKRVAASDNEDIRPVRVSGIRRAWNAPGVRAKALQVRQLLLLRRTAAAHAAAVEVPTSSTSRALQDSQLHMRLAAQHLRTCVLQPPTRTAGATLHFGACRPRWCGACHLRWRTAYVYTLPPILQTTAVLLLGQAKHMPTSSLLVQGR